jgi:hypothetical protein
MIAVGDKVIAKIDITQGADEDGPAQVFATKGTPLVVRRIGQQCLHVSHEDITDQSFRVFDGEVIDFLPDGKLTYAVTVQKWERVAKIIREFKKKKHVGYFLDVEELPSSVSPEFAYYRVWVYKEA